MRAASGTLIALLNSGAEFQVADLLTITQSNGTVTRLTSADFDVTANSHTYLSSGPKFSRTKTKLIIGLEVDSMTLSLYCDPVVDLLAGIPWPAAAINGALDGARVVVEKAFMGSLGWGDTTPGTFIVFSGQIATITPSRQQIDLEVKSDLTLLDAQMPRNLYQPGCVHSLYDSGCTLSKAAFTDAGTVTSGSTLSAVHFTSAKATGYYDLGTLLWLTGPNSGALVTVQHFTTGGIAALQVNLKAVPVVGDTFSISPGCSKTLAVCIGTFSNSAHFRGFPFVPLPESAT
jgi:uncharacterized phage protein (TIGR02218 family)